MAVELAVGDIESGQALTEVGLLILVVVVFASVGLALFGSAVLDLWAVEVAQASAAL